MGDWRENKDVEVQLDGIGGVNILVKADVHRSGSWSQNIKFHNVAVNIIFRHQLSSVCF